MVLTFCLFVLSDTILDRFLMIYVNNSFIEAKNPLPSLPPPPPLLSSLPQPTSRGRASVLKGQGAEERETDTQEGAAIIGS